MPDRFWTASSTGVNQTPKNPSSVYGSDLLPFLANVVKMLTVGAAKEFGDSSRRLIHTAGMIGGVDAGAGASPDATINDLLNVGLAIAPAVGPARKLRLSHYSKEPRKVIDPKFLGTGYSSAELRGGVPRVKMASFYNEAAGRPERSVVSSAPVKHEVEGRFKVLDLATDTGKEAMMEAMRKGQPGTPEFLSELNRVIGKAGYDGYLNSEVSPNIYRLLKPQVPTKIYE